MALLDDTRDADNLASDRSIKRRTLLKGLAGGFAGSVAASGQATTSDEMAVVQGPPAAATNPVTGLPRLLDDHQRRTLSSLAEILVPGAAAAGVVDLMDRVAAIDSSTGQRRLLNAIARFDHEAQSAHGRPWNDIDDRSRLAILIRASASAVPAPTPATQPASPAEASLTAQFEYLRSAVATVYFRTEAGMRERGWTGRTAWTALPGCPHPAGVHE